MVALFDGSSAGSGFADNGSDKIFTLMLSLATNSCSANTDLCTGHIPEARKPLAAFLIVAAFA